jgi:hypothetical protein
MGSRRGGWGSLICPPRVIQLGARQAGLVGHFPFSAKFICMGKQKNRLTTPKPIHMCHADLPYTCQPARLCWAARQSRPKPDCRVSDLPCRRAHAHAYTLRSAGLPQPRPSLASLPCTTRSLQPAGAAASPAPKSCQPTLETAHRRGNC